jgi:D-alanyl-lipoteichoic acid acyltransferase DltB (MBOAT superfamily)
MSRNATTMDYYWRTWNIPTHHWLVRHIYFPSLRAGYSKRTAAILVFLFSAVFHEVRRENFHCSSTDGAAASVLLY